MEGVAEGKGYQKRPRGENWFRVSALLQLRIPRHRFVNAAAETLSTARGDVPAAETAVTGQSLPELQHFYKQMEMQE